MIRFGIAATTALALGACVSTADGEDDADAIVIGAAIAKTGFMASFDMPVHHSLQIAVDKANASGGIDGRPIRLEAIDNKSDSTQSANAASRLIEQGADLLIVTCNFSTGGPAATVAQNAGVVSFAPCASDTRFGPLGLGDLVFNLGMSIPTEGAALADYAMKKGWKSVYTLTDTELDYPKNTCEAFEKRFTELGGKIAGKDVFRNSDQAIASQVSRAGEGAVDALVLCSYPPGGAMATLQLRQGGIDLPILANFGMDGDYWAKSLPQLSDFYVISPASLFGDDPKPEVNQLLADYRKKAGGNPPTGSFVYGATTFQLIKQVIEETGGTDGTKIAAALEQSKNLRTITGPMSFGTDYHVDFEWDVRVLKATGGRFSYVETVVPRNARALVK
ncbi:ABC transporter substrate-binding protein [Actinomadura chokoriensis]|uniref:ABC transporter substrate-binding protein n=1 Tax=Actinomadura chokoriensis TaxID=454156 RepID=UPI0031F77887